MKIFGWVFLFISIFCYPLWADVIQFTNGTSIEGKIIEQTSDHIKVTTDVGLSVTYYSDEISSINGIAFTQPEELKKTVELPIQEIDSKTSVINNVDDKAPENKLSVEEPTTIQASNNASASQSVSQNKNSSKVDTGRVINSVDPEYELAEKGRELSALGEHRPFYKVTKEYGHAPTKESIQASTKEEKEKLLKEARSVFRKIAESDPSIKEFVLFSGEKIVGKVDFHSLYYLVVLTADNQAIRIFKSEILSEKVIEDKSKLIKKPNYTYWYSVFILSWILVSYPLMRIANRLYVSHAWMAWVPVLNFALMFRCAGISLWWMLILFIPILNLFAIFVLLVLTWMGIAKSLDKPSWFGVLMLLPIVNLVVPWYLALAKDESSETERISEPPLNN